jgi:hypothetical protein
MRSGFFSFELFLYMPGDSLALAVGVGCEDHLVGFFGERGELGNNFCFAGHHLVVGDKARRDIDRFFI